MFLSVPDVFVAVANARPSEEYQKPPPGVSSALAGPHRRLSRTNDAGTSTRAILWFARWRHHTRSLEPCELAVIDALHGSFTWTRQVDVTRTLPSLRLFTIYHVRNNGT